MPTGLQMPSGRQISDFFLDTIIAFPYNIMACDGERVQTPRFCISTGYRCESHSGYKAERQKVIVMK